VERTWIPQNHAAPAGLTISDFAGDTAAAWVSDGATVTLVRSSFTANYITDTYYNSAILTVSAVDSNGGSVGGSGGRPQDTIVRMQQCTFSNDFTANQLLTIKGNYFSEYSAVIYSDDASFHVVHVSDQGAVRVPGSTKPLSGADAARQGLSGKSAWLQRAQRDHSMSSFSLESPHQVMASMQPTHAC
jgi:hypothetical protein